MSAQTTMRGPVHLPTRSIVLLVVVLAIIVVVAASWWPSATTPTTPAGVHGAARADQPLTSLPTQQAIVVGQGVYLVGSDMPEGTYKGRATQATAYWQISLDAQGSQVLRRSGRLTGEFSVQVAEGQYLHVVGAQLIRLA